MAIPNRNWVSSHRVLPPSSFSPASLHRKASQSPRDRAKAAGPSYISSQDWPRRGHAVGCGALVDTSPRSLSFWERAQQWAGGGQRTFAVSEKGSLDPLQLLLMDETARAGGASRSACPGLLPQCSGIPGPSPVTQRNSFCLFYTLSSGKKGILFQNRA